jgi:replicative DNA helicase
MDHELDELKMNLLDYVNKNLTPTQRGPKHVHGGEGRFYNCPICGSGTGQHGTGALLVSAAKNGKPPVWYCHQCHAGGTLIDLIMALERKDQAQAIARAKELYGNGGGVMQRTTHEQHKFTEVATQETETPQDYTVYFNHCKNKIGQTDYLKGRGLSDKVINAFNIGYDPTWTHPAAKNALPTPRVIIPTGKNTYLARDTRPDAQLTEQQRNYKKMKVGHNAPLFNGSALNNPFYTIVVEGEIDALSIIEVGGNALALGSTNLAKLLINKLTENPYKGTLVISLDPDPAGAKATAEIIAACDTLGVKYMTLPLNGAYHDANDRLVKDRAGLAAAVAKVANQEKDKALDEYYKESSGAEILNFENEITERAATPFIPTGFKELDKILDGGLYEGLYFLGAISSLGKTTFILQVADQIAAAGHDVLFFSLEQSNTELKSKSLSRLTYTLTSKNEKTAKSARYITTKHYWQYFSQDEIDYIRVAMINYNQQTYKHLFILEGIADIGVDEIAARVKKHIALTGNTPVVIIDYLQILKPEDMRATDKQNTDRAVTRLKRLSRDLKLPIIGISSFNRDNYWAKVNLASFKESGAIEYSSDVLMALAPADMTDGGTDKEKKENRELIEKIKMQPTRDVELYILKNRNGATGGRVPLAYTSKFNYFEETGKAFYPGRSLKEQVKDNLPSI